MDHPLVELYTIIIVLEGLTLYVVAVILQSLKNIPHFALPNLYGITSKCTDTFLFKFDVLCHSYDYTSNTQKMKLFPSMVHRPWRGDYLFLRQYENGFS